MKRLLFAAVAAASLAMGAPVLAQPYPPTTAPALPGRDIPGQIEALRAQVKAGFDSGQLSRASADGAYRELDRIGAVARSDRLPDGRLSEHDRSELQSRLDAVSRSLPAVVSAPPPPPPAMADAPPPSPALAWTLQQREDWLQGRIDRGVDDHRLSGHEVTRGQGELQAIRTEQARLTERDGGALSVPDHDYLSSRIDQLNQTLKWEGRNPPPPWTTAP